MEDGKGGFLCKLDEKETWVERLRQLANDERLRTDMGLLNIEQIKKSGGIAMVLYPSQFEDFKNLIIKLQGG